MALNFPPVDAGDGIPQMGWYGRHLMVVNDVRCKCSWLESFSCNWY